MPYTKIRIATLVTSLSRFRRGMALYMRPIISRLIADRLWFVFRTPHVPTRNMRFNLPGIVNLIMTVVLAILCVTGCSDPKPEVFSVVNRARTEDGEPLPGLRILENGKSRGQTDEAGMLFLRIRGFAGRQITFLGVCPEGYRRSSQSRTITLQHLTGLENTRIASAPEVSWRCSSLRQITALVIRASAQPNLPVAIDGKRVGRTTADGLAHFLLKEPAGSRVLVSLDTSKYSNLRPQNPQRFFQIRERNAILIFDQQFTKAPAKKRRRKSKPTPQRHVPYRIID